MDAWRTLINSFVDGAIDAPTFETKFLALHRDEVALGHSVRYAVDLLFYEVDAYCSDTSLRGPADIDEAQLLEAAKNALREWERPWPPLPQ
jgi:hypothetical protein